MNIRYQIYLHGCASRHQAPDHDDGVVNIEGVLVVQDAEPQPLLPLGQHDLLHVMGPGGGVGEDLQGPRPRHHTLPENKDFSFCHFSLSAKVCKLSCKVNLHSRVSYRHMASLWRLILLTKCLTFSYIELDDISFWCNTGERIRENSLLAWDEMRINFKFLLISGLTFTSGASQPGSEISSSDWRLPHNIFWNVTCYLLSRRHIPQNTVSLLCWKPVCCNLSRRCWQWFREGARGRRPSGSTPGWHQPRPDGEQDVIHGKPLLDNTDLLQGFYHLLVEHGRQVDTIDL